MIIVTSHLVGALLAGSGKTLVTNVVRLERFYLLLLDMLAGTIFIIIIILFTIPLTFLLSSSHKLRESQNRRNGRRTQ